MPAPAKSSKTGASTPAKQPAAAAAQPQPIYESKKQQQQQQSAIAAAEQQPAAQAAGPHSNMQFILGVSLVLFSVALHYGFNTWDPATTFGMTSAKRGLFSVMALFAAFGLLFARDTEIKAPTRLFWRLNIGLALFYMACLAFAFMQSRDSIREILHFFDSRVGMPADVNLMPKEEDFCMLQNLQKTLNIYILAHIVGYSAFAIATRDIKMCFLLSGTFEFIEIGMQHWMPDFRECWWDHIVVDVLISNPLGIFIGFQVLKFFKQPRFDWIGDSSKQWSIMILLSPWSWVRGDWISLRSLFHFFAALFCFLLMTMAEFNSFIFKDSLFISTSHPICIFRVYIWICMTISALSELYPYLYAGTKEAESRKLPKPSSFMHAWVAIGIMILELLVCVRIGDDIFTKTTPNHVWVPTFAFVFFTLLWLLVHWVLLGFVSNRRFIKWIPSGTLIALAYGSLLFLFFSGCVDVGLMRKELDALPIRPPQSLEQLIDIKYWTNVITQLATLKPVVLDKIEHLPENIVAFGGVMQEVGQQLAIGVGNILKAKQ